jgi:hypothetical protein
MTVFSADARSRHPAGRMLGRLRSVIQEVWASGQRSGILPVRDFKNATIKERSLSLGECPIPDSPRKPNAGRLAICFIKDRSKKKHIA